MAMGWWKVPLTICSILVLGIFISWGIFSKTDNYNLEYFGLSKEIAATSSYKSRSANITAEKPQNAPKMKLKAKKIAATSSYKSISASITAEKPQNAPKMKLKATKKPPPPPTCRKKPVILLWTRWFGGDWGISQGNVKCGNIQCEITSNHGRYKSSDALIFHGVSPQVMNQHYYPSKSSRPPKQLWVFRTMENPNIAEKLGCKLTSFHNNLFHATMSYTRQADVRLCYGKVLKEPHDATDHNRNYAAGKTKFAAWVSSQCYPGRTSFVKDLSKYISIDKFGRCGNQRCAKDGSCMRRIGLQYKFYLSFENFICRDYVTEKYYRNAINNNLIPIVVGGANYSDNGIVPPHSYINAQDFSTVEELANYLKKVAANATLYNSYFKWKDSYKIHSPCSATQSFCELCHKLCDDKWVTEKSKKTIPDLTYKWGIHRDNCVDYSDIFHKGSDSKITIHPRVY